MVHSLALSAFYPPYDRASCLEIKGVSAYLDGHAPGIDDTRADGMARISRISS